MKETAIQREILDWLDRRGFLCWRNANMVRYGYNKYQPKGMPDIFFMVQGMLMGIEVKSESGKVSKEQIAWGDKLIMAGGHYFVVRSLQELIEVLDFNFGGVVASLRNRPLPVGDIDTFLA